MSQPAIPDRHGVTTCVEDAFRRMIGKLQRDKVAVDGDAFLRDFAITFNGGQAPKSDRPIPGQSADVMNRIDRWARIECQRSLRRCTANGPAVAKGAPLGVNLSQRKHLPFAHALRRGARIGSPNAGLAHRTATVKTKMSGAVADSGTVQALTSLAMAPKPRLNLLSAACILGGFCPFHSQLLTFWARRDRFRSHQHRHRKPKKFYTWAPRVGSRGDLRGLGRGDPRW